VTDVSRFDPLLKAELDLLMVENQVLHRELRRLEEPSFVLRRVLGAAKSAARRRLVAARPGHAAARAADRERPHFAESFRPYVVRPLQPPANSRPRVLHVIANFYTGGSPRLVVDLVERLGHLYEQVVVVRDNPSEPHYLGLEIHVVPDLRSPAKAKTILRRLQPDLVHVHFLAHHRHWYSQADWEWYDGLFAAAAGLGKPVVENVNIPVPPYFSDAVACYVFVSEYVRTVFGRDEDRNATIYPGSDFEIFTAEEAAAPAEPCVGMVYRLEKDKLDESVIDVFIEVVQRRPGTKALIVGGGRFLDRYRRAVADAGLAEDVEFTAYVAFEDLPALYRRMSIFVAPPHSESFGHVVPLAMNMGIPVAAYRVGALPEILGDDSVLAPAGDVAALAGKVVELLDDDERRRRLRVRNRDRAERLFSVEKMVEDYRSLYDELLAAS
jgi:glycosyltransferase involved in cell wall biosynthesis